VFGGSGFIGTKLVGELSNDGIGKITSVDLLLPRMKLPNVEFVIADIGEPIALKERPEIVFNLAAVSLALVKLVPLIVSVVSPATGPEVGEMEVTVSVAL